jgi:NitT/TauT family transport system substrate-binding protein
MRDQPCTNGEAIMPDWKRASALLLTIVVMPFLLVSMPHADEAHTLSYRLSWVPTGSDSPVYLAAEKGWFKRAGLDVTIVPGNGSVTTVQLVNAGQHDVGYASLAMMAVGRSSGMSSVTSIAGVFRKLDLGLLVPEESTIKGPADVRGKNLIFTAGSFEGPFIDPFLAKGGLTRADVNLMNLAYAARFSTYINGGADGLFGAGTGDYAQVSAKRPTRRILFADVGLNVPSFGFVTTQNALEKKGDALRKFVSIAMGTWMYILAGHEKEAAEAVVQANPQGRLDPEQILAQIKLCPPFFTTPATANLPLGVQSAEDWAAGIEVMEKANMIKPGSKPSDYFTNDYLDVSLIKSIASEK